MSQDIAQSTAGEIPGRFGPYGGRYVPETLIPALDELTEAWAEARGLAVQGHWTGEALEARFGFGAVGRRPVPAFAGLVELVVPG